MALLRGMAIVYKDFKDSRDDAFEKVNNTHLDA